MGMIIKEGMSDSSGVEYFKELEAIGLRRFEFEKGLPLYKYVDIDTAKIILENQTFKFSNAYEFNDPLELTPSLLNFNITEEVASQRLKKSIMGIPNKTRAEKRKLFKSTPRNFFSEKIQSVVEQSKTHYGILCLSEINNSTLMWSHYSKNHTGCCIEVTFVDPLKWNPAMVGMRVNYSKELKSVNLIDENADYSGNAFFYWVFTKSKVWDYEKEVRILSHNYSGLISFPHHMITKIIYGLKTPKTEIGIIEKMLKNKDYKVLPSQQMQIIDGTFDIQPIQIP